VTGGGITENLPRVLAEGMVAHVTRPPTPPIFRLIAERGPVEQAEMDRTFNMGVGMVVVVDGAAVSKTLDCLTATGEDCFELGTIGAGHGAPYVKFTA